MFFVLLYLIVVEVLDLCLFCFYFLGVSLVFIVKMNFVKMAGRVLIVWTVSFVSVMSGLGEIGNCF